MNNIQFLKLNSKNYTNMSDDEVVDDIYNRYYKNTEKYKNNFDGFKNDMFKQRTTQELNNITINQLSNNRTIENYTYYDTVLNQEEYDKLQSKNPIGVFEAVRKLNASD